MKNRQFKEDLGGKLLLLGHNRTGLKYDFGTSFSASKVSHTVGMIANKFPDKSANFIKNMLLLGSDYPAGLMDTFYSIEGNEKATRLNFNICGYGLSDYDRAVNSYSNRVVLWDESEILLDNIKVYSVNLPESFWTESGRRKLTGVLTYDPETRHTRGDSYIGNQLSFYLHSADTIDAVISSYSEDNTNNYPKTERNKKIELTPGVTTLKTGCHQKTWKEYKRKPNKIQGSKLFLVIKNQSKWINDPEIKQSYCISLTIEHEKDIDIYNKIRERARVK